MKIGFDAKRAFHNATGLGNYSRFIIEALLSHCPENEYVAYSQERNAARSRVDGRESRVSSPQSNVESPTSKIQRPQSKIQRLFPSFWRSYGVVSQLKADEIEVYHGLSNELPIGLNKTKIKSVVTIHDYFFYLLVKIGF